MRFSVVRFTSLSWGRLEEGRSLTRGRCSHQRPRAKDLPMSATSARAGHFGDSTNNNRTKNLQEITAGKLLPVHPGVPIFFGSFETTSGLHLVWERIFGDNLESVFKRKNKGNWRPSEKKGLSWAQQLFSALACLHASHLIHRDVKPANIMVTNDLKTISLVDFSLCRACQIEKQSDTAGTASARPMTGEIGSHRFMAPEVFLASECYDAKIDVYSAAMVTFLILTGKIPFSTLPGHAVAGLATRCALRPSVCRLRNVQVRQLLTRAWHTDPASRPDAHMIEVELQQAAVRPRSQISSIKDAASKIMAKLKFTRASSSGSETDTPNSARSYAELKRCNTDPPLSVLNESNVTGVNSSTSSKSGSSVGYTTSDDSSDTMQVSCMHPRHRVLEKTNTF